MTEVLDIVRQLPDVQLRELERLIVENPGSTWHLNECGCCICLHPGGDKTRGWIIGEDGGSDYVEREEPHE